jgi:hypothetical protein
MGLACSGELDKKARAGFGKIVVDRSDNAAVVAQSAVKDRLRMLCERNNNMRIGRKAIAGWER